MFYYTGIGSRQTPDKILSLMEQLGSYLGQMGYNLRSGGANGADSAFEKGCIAVNGRKEIFLPWPGFRGKSGEDYLNLNLNSSEAIKIAALCHPRWATLREGDKLLHARNVHQVLGRDLQSPSQFILFWSRSNGDGDYVGGTSQAIRVAARCNVPYFDLGIKEKYDEFLRFIRV